MVKLTGYEIKKLLKHKLILLLLLTGTLMTALMMLESSLFKEYGWTRQDKGAYKRYINATYDMPFEDAVEWLQTERKGEYALLIKYKSMEYTIRPIILSMIVNRYSYVEMYGDTIQKVLKQANRVKTSEFYRSDAFALSDAEKILEDYSGLEDISVSRDAALFVEGVTAFDTTDYILLFQLMLITILVFGVEDDNLKRLLRAQDRGRSHVFFAKVAALMCISAVLVFFTYLYLMAVGFAYYGKGATDVPLQSLESFWGSKHRLMIGEFMVLFPILKVVGAWVFVFIFSLCIILVGSVAGSVLSITITGLFYAMYFSLGGRTLLSPLKYINPASWFDVNRWMSEYANINFFTKAVSFEAAFVIGAAALSLVIVLLSKYFYIRERERKIYAVSVKVTSLFENVKARLIGSASLVFHEAYRLLAEGCRWAVVIIFVVLAVWVTDGLVNTRIYKNNTYRYYLESIEPEYSDETMEYLAKQFRHLREIDSPTLESFNILYTQGKNLRMHDELGVKNLGFIDKKWTDDILMSGSSMVVPELIFACMLFVVFGGYLTSDYNVFNLIKSSYRGRWENQWIKIAGLIIISLIVMSVQLIVYYSKALEGLGNTDVLGFGIRSIDMYSSCGMDITVKEMFMISIIFKYIGLIYIGLFMYFLSICHLPKPVFQIIVLFVTVMPPAIEVISSQTYFLGFSPFFYMEQLFKRGMWDVVTYAVAVSVLLAVFGVLAVRRYRGKQYIGRRACNG